VVEVGDVQVVEPAVGGDVGHVDVDLAAAGKQRLQCAQELHRLLDVLVHMHHADEVKAALAGRHQGLNRRVQRATCVLHGKGAKHRVGLHGHPPGRGHLLGQRVQQHAFGRADVQRLHAFTQQAAALHEGHRLGAAFVLAVAVDVGQAGLGSALVEAAVVLAVKGVQRFGRGLRVAHHQAASAAAAGVQAHVVAVSGGQKLEGRAATRRAGHGFKAVVP
jgi:hypothetical protein